MKELLEKLVSFKTTHQEENKKEFDKAFDYIISQIKSNVKNFKLVENGGYKSLILWKKDKPKIIYMCHLDVVPARKEDFILRETADKFFGRGVLDNKFAIAVLIEILREIKDKEIPFGAIITSDEEIGGFRGANYVINNLKFLGDLFIVPDSGLNLSLETEAKGVLHIKISIKGKKAHGSTPWKGKNALDEFWKGYSRLRKIYPEYKKPTWKPTLNLGKVSGGEAANQVCDYMEALLDFRYPFGYKKEKILNDVKKCFENSKINIIAEGEPIKTDLKNEYIKKWLNIARRILKRNIKLTKSYGATDARFLAKHNIPFIITEPKGGNYHADNEWIDKKSLMQFKEILKEFLLS